MAKSKYSPALFELIDKGDRRHRPNPLAVPKWFGRKPAAEPPAPAAGRADETDAAASAAAERLTLVHPADEENAFCTIQLGDRGVGLNQVSTIVVGCLALLLLVGAFALGRMTAGDSGAVANAGIDDVTKALQGPADPDALKVGRSSTGASRSTAKDSSAPTGAKPGEADKAMTDAPTANREPGVNYVVIETFRTDHRKSGEVVRDWIKKEYGLDATLERVGDRLGLVTTLGFDYKEPGQKERCEDFLKQVKELSEDAAKELSAKGLPVYRLLSPYPKQYPK